MAGEEEEDLPVNFDDVGSPMQDIFGGDAGLNNYEELDYENLSELLAQQLQDVGDYFSNDMLPYFSDLPNETSPLQISGAINFGALEGLQSANRRYQQVLRDQLVLLEEGQKMTRELQRWLKMLLIQMKQRKKSSTSNNLGYTLTSLTLVDTNGQAPPENSETHRLKPLLAEYGKSMKHAVKWTEREKMALAKAVRQQNQAILVDRILTGEEVIGFGICCNINNGPREFNSQGRAQLYRHAVSTVQRMSQRELEMNLEGLDWTRVSALSVPSRSPDDCRIQWTTNQHPLISHSPFTNEETKRLNDLVVKYGSQGRWIEIAEELGTNRSAWQCLAAHRQACGKTVASGKWTPEEDRILTEGVQIYGTSDCWTEISEMLDGRSPAQCVHRWNKTLDPTKKTGRWTNEEDAWLCAAVTRYGCTNWALVQQFVPNRTDVQCRERYMNVLNPQLKHETFSPMEDAILKRAVTQFGQGKWSQVAALLPNRTDNQCRRRWLVINSSRFINRLRGRPKLSKPLNNTVNPSFPPTTTVIGRSRGRPRKVRH